MVRSAKSNRSQDKFHLTGFLWRDELDSLAKSSGVNVRGKDLIKDVRHKVSDALPLVEIRACVLRALKSRYS